MKKRLISLSMVTILLGITFFCPSCMSDKEWQLRNKQLENQANHKDSIDVLDITGPITVEVKEGGRVVVKSPNQPFKEVQIPDGIKTQEQLIAHLLDVGAITVLGYKALKEAGHNKKTYNYGDSSEATDFDADLGL